MRGETSGYAVGLCMSDSIDLTALLSERRVRIRTLQAASRNSSEQEEPNCPGGRIFFFIFSGRRTADPGRRNLDLFSQLLASAVLKRGEWCLGVDHRDIRVSGTGNGCVLVTSGRNVIEVRASTGASVMYV